MADNLNNEIQDPSKIGVSGLNGINRQSNVQTESLERQVYMPRNQQQQLMYGIETQKPIGFVGVNDSRFDRRITNLSQLADIEEFRANEQNTFNQLAGAIGRGAVIAGTEFARGSILGLGVNIGMAIADEGYIDNPFNRALNNIQEWSREVMPERLTRNEQESPWKRRPGNFLGSLIETGGYQVGNVGAMLAGGVGAVSSKLAGGIAKAASAGLNMVKAGSAAGPILQQFNNAANIAKNQGWISSALSSFAGATSEATVESLSAKDEYIQKGEQELRQYAEGNPDFDLDFALNKLNQDADKIGQATYIMNLGLLSVSNAAQWGRLMARNFGTARRSANALKNISKLDIGLNTARKAITEGGEELSQRIVSNATKAKYGSEFNSFYGDRILGEYNKEGQNLLSSILDSSKNALTDDEAWFEFMAGGLMGAGGTVLFRKPGVNTEAGKFQMPIYGEGGIWGEIREAKTHNQRAELLRNELNEWFAKPENIEKYQGFVRSQALQRAKDIAVEKDDHYTFGNADHAQLLSDIIMFDKSGRIQDLYDIIDSTANLSDSDIAEIRESMYNIKTKQSAFEGMEDNEIKEIVQNQANRIRSTIKNYYKTNTNLKAILGNTLQNRELEELTYYMSNVDNFSDRFKDMHGRLKEILSPYTEAMSMQGLSEEQQAELTELQQVLNSSPETLLSYIMLAKNKFAELIDKSYSNNRVLLTQNKDIDTAINHIIQNEKLSKKDDVKLFAALEKARNIIKNSSEIDAKAPELKKIAEDMMRIAAARATLLYKYNGFLKDPQALRESLNRQEEEILDEDVKKSKSTLKENLLAAKDTVEFDAALNSEPNEILRDEAVKELIREDNQIAKDYNSEFDYVNNIHVQLNKIEDKDLKTNAKAVFNAFKTANPGIVNFANPNVIASLNKADLELNDMSDSDFDAARREIIMSQYEVNELEAYKNRFNSNYRKPEVKKDIEKDTIEAVVEETQILIGEAKETDVIAEQNQIQEETQKSNNNKLDKYRSGDANYFYRPAISDSKPNFTSAEGEARFNKIYDYLNDNGAFNLDSEDIAVGDEIGFMIDPAVNTETIFMIKSNGQVIGSLNESGKALKNSKNLNRLIKTVKNEFSASENKTSRFVASPSVHITALMDGKIFYSEEEFNPLQAIANTENPIFGIVKNGILNTNDKLNSNDIELAAPLLEREGHVYLLYKTINGNYRPIALRTVRFDKDTINNLKGKPIYDRRIKPNITRLASSINEDEMRAALMELGRDLYIAPLQFDMVVSRGNSAIRIELRGNKESVKYIPLTTTATIGLSDDLVEEIQENRPVEDISNDLEVALNSYNLPIQINVKEINKGGYNTYLRNSDVLYSNTRNAKPTFNWFITEYLDDNGDSQNIAENDNQQIATEAIADNSISEGAVVGFINDDNIIDETGTVVNQKGEDITDVIKTEQTIVSEAPKLTPEEARNKLNTLKKRFSKPTRKAADIENPVKTQTSLYNTTISVNDIEISNKKDIFAVLVFNDLSDQNKEALKSLGWTEDKFNSVSQEERNHALECLGY